MLGLVLISGCKPHLGKSATSRQADRIIGAAADYLQNGKEAKAIAAFRKASDLDSRNFNTQQKIVENLVVEGKCKEAIPFIRRAIDLPPDGRDKRDLFEDKRRDSAMYTILGDCYNKPHMIEQAEESYGQAVKLDNTNATAYNDWAYMYADLGIKKRDALRLAKKAEYLDPESPEIIDTVGWAYYQLGRYREAREALEKAVKLEPNSAEIRYHLGCACEELGDHAAALVEYHKAIALFPDYKEAKNSLKKFSKNP